MAPTVYSNPAVIRARGVVKSYGDVHALAGIDLDIAAGRFTSIMGPSGSGKSTLMHVLAGLDTVDQGSIQLGGTELTQLDDNRLTVLRRERIGFVFQSFNLLPMLTAEQNILLPIQLSGATVDRAWFTTLVEAFKLSDRLTHLPSQLSGGQVQRIAIARALITSPDVVFADEPTGNLDTATSTEVLDFLRLSVDQFGQTIVMVTHEPSAAAKTDRIVTLRDGQIISDSMTVTGGHR
ncbi:ABC transporter ATP-binding protein [Devriesea agamarum]|uniref:ABC transporter ATP-binding protein n=1 Tax=Devriesea agamarum TaxID=472569 RepID=UPI00071DE233|nr:ABC transporter ATP-binding protein [Devriesea agamarum]